MKCQGGRNPAQLFKSVVQLLAEVCSVISARRQLAGYFLHHKMHTEQKCVSVLPLPHPNLLPTSHTGQKKDPGKHCNKEAADRGGEAKAPVHKGARCL